MKFKAWVMNEQNEWIHLETIRWIDLDKNGRPVRICGPTGLQYSEFELDVEGIPKPHIEVLPSEGVSE